MVNERSAAWRLRATLSPGLDGENVCLTPSFSLCALVNICGLTGVSIVALPSWLPASHNASYSQPFEVLQRLYLAAYDNNNKYIATVCATNGCALGMFAVMSVTISNGASDQTVV